MEKKVSLKRTKTEFFSLESWVFVKSKGSKFDVECVKNGNISQKCLFATNILDSFKKNPIMCKIGES